MSVIIFDTETTGLYPGHICQLAYVKVDEGRVSAKNYYFPVDYMEPAAQNVHHLSVEMLHELSGGCSFESKCAEILEEFNSAEIVIAHNYAFDSAFMRAEATANGAVYTAKGFCTMNKFRDVCKLKGRNGYKNPKLDELIEYFGITAEEITEFTHKLFGDDGMGKHDARVDTAALALVVLHGAKKKVGGLDEFPQITELDRC